MKLNAMAQHHSLDILHHFEESLRYWSQLSIDLKDHKQGGTSLTKDNSVTIDNVPAFAHNLLKKHFMEKEAALRSTLIDAQFQLYKQTQYALIALIDDQLLQAPPWDDKDAWLSHMLEAELFKSRIAGQRLIDNIEDLINHRHFAEQQDTERQLAYVYLNVLWLGFKGRLFNNDAKLRELQLSLTQLTGFLPINLKSKRYLAQPYNYTTNDPDNENQPNRRLAPIGKWHKVVLISAIVYGVISTAVWYGFTWDLEHTLETYISDNSTKTIQDNNQSGAHR